MVFIKVVLTSKFFCSNNFARKEIFFLLKSFFKETNFFFPIFFFKERKYFFKYLFKETKFCFQIFLCDTNFFTNSRWRRRVWKSLYTGPRRRGSRGDHGPPRILEKLQFFLIWHVFPPNLLFWPPQVGLAPSPESWRRGPCNRRYSAIT